MWEWIASAWQWVASKLGGGGSGPRGNENQSSVSTATGYNSTAISATGDAAGGNLNKTTYNYHAPPSAPDPDAEMFDDLEATIPELMNDLRDRLRNNPLQMRFAATESSAPFIPWVRDANSWRYDEDKMPGVLNSVQRLVDRELITRESSMVYRIMPDLEKHLKKPR